MTPQELTELDRAFVWHPFSRLNEGPGEIQSVVSAQGSQITLADGRQIIDGISSWWVNIHGHCHPKIAQAIAHQAATLDHVIFAGFTHPPAAQLASELTREARRAGADSEKVFFSDDGSTSVEVALKLALQFHINLGQPERRRILALRGAYHGDTFGAMAVSEPSGFHARFKDFLMPVDFFDPHELSELKQLLNKNSGQYAALIVEPLVQGASGMRMYDSAALDLIGDLCRQENILTICDEIFTGFFRTARFFAFEHTARFRPDLICLSKGITGGFLPLAVTLCSKRIHENFTGSAPDRIFLHGHSYTANPIACAAALASLEILREPETQTRIQEITTQTREWIQKLGQMPRVLASRCLGTLGVIELKGDAQYGSATSLAMRGAALQKGVLLRPLGNVVYSLPPYCTSRDELDQVFLAIQSLAE